MTTIPSYLRNCNGRCAFPLSSIPLPEERTLELLTQAGFLVLNDCGSRHTLITECLPYFAIRHCGICKYSAKAKPTDAPITVNCSSFVSFIYGQMGVHLPRRAIQQSEIGIPIALKNIQVGDLVFTTGHINRYRDDPAQAVGHVALVITPTHFIHADRQGVRQITAKKFFKTREFRVARRLITPKDSVVLVSCPNELCIETADDIYWKLTEYL